jgi:iron complex transport system permease protein
MRSLRSKSALVGLSLFCLGVLLVAPWIGSKILFPSDLSVASEHQIFWLLRVPRVLVAFLSGAGLALCGMTFQAMFRNALATPYTLGVSSGAALGAALYVHLGLSFGLLGLSGVSLCAFVGAMAAMMLVFWLTRIKGGFSTATMLLAGVAVNFSFASLLLFIQYMSDFSDSFRIMRWLMGGVEAAGYEDVLNVLPFVLLGSLLLIYHANDLNLLSTGEDLALSRGVAVGRTRLVLFVVTSLMVGAVVALYGPIGFVGMMAPHICRLLIGSNHRILAPASFLFGGAFLVLCDMLARTLIAPAEMPVGILTALLGGPFFLWLLVANSQGRHMV